ncbi:Na+/H+ antiporter NhaC family protein [Carboxylicivirga marina]|uniref:Na+/H+ antiporter NhaC family protein n=1 Tax=Carboxylicivirga marina TaxID=2800988 RepID=UPI0025962A89|nr:Na+/H+ antiporter NhaC family protein [uncultured Carboxylicivirga sp.]
MPENSISLLPPLVAILIALWRKNAIIALLSGVILCWIMVSDWHIIEGLGASSLSLLNIFKSANQTYIIVFSLLIGALVKLLNQSGAVNGFILLLSRIKLVTNKRRAALLPTIIGTIIFTDTNLSMFTAGMASQQLFDKYKLSRAQLAYLIDSTCAPVSILILINGWGAYILGLLDGFALDNKVSIVVSTIVFNFYAIMALIIAYYTAFSCRTFGYMNKTKPSNTLKIKDSPTTKISPPIIMWLPLLTILLTTLTILWYTGDGDLRQGDGAFAVFCGVIISIILCAGLIRYHRALSIQQITKNSFKGIKEMFPAVAILVLSFAFGDGIKALGTGVFVSEVMNLQVATVLIAPILFLIAGIMAFATGSSWGTYAILIPIAIPVALDSGLPVPFVLAAVLGGGIFGDHASPISDTTVIASIASGCDHYEHVKTQLPYAVIIACVSLILYLLFGFYLM